MTRSLFATMVALGLSMQGVAFAQAAAESQVGDTDITNRVLSELSVADRDVVRQIHVSTENGVVTVEGTVLTGTQLTKVLADVRAVSGVTKVKNRLQIIM